LLARSGDTYAFMSDTGNYLKINDKGQIMPEEKIKFEKEKTALKKKINFSDNDQGKLNGINIILDYIDSYQEFYNKNHNPKNVNVWKNSTNINTDKNIKTSSYVDISLLILLLSILIILGFRFIKYVRKFS
jgi:hypothetical protein